MDATNDYNERRRRFKRWDRIDAAQTRQLILESRQMRAIQAKGRLQ